MLKDYLPWIIAGLIVVALVVIGVVVSRTTPAATAARRRRARPSRDHFRSGDEAPAELKRAGVIINPTKFADVPMVRERITATCHAAGWGDPLFFETTAADTGHGQAKEAIRAGASVVCSLGGDGTVRAVATALIGTDMPLGVLPAGTGNLLARNLDLPVERLDAAVTVALTGRNRRIDVGELVVTEPVAPGPEGDDPAPAIAPSRHEFLVMGGIGMDAAIMAGTSQNLKDKVGWPAYLLSGAKHLVSPEFRTTISLDGAPEFKRRARMLVIGNCGKLLGGLVLMPSARIDDGQLDVVIASPRGVVGWVPVATRMLTRQRKGHPTLDQKTCQQVRVRTDRPQPVQIDGDVIGLATEVTATVRPGVLTVRVSQT
ncbi:MAG: diacylglycerol kinase family protein [Terracoccus sp.]